MVACALASSRLDNANSVLFGTTQKKHLQVSESTEPPCLCRDLPVIHNLAVHALSSSSSTGSPLDTALT